MGLKRKRSAAYDDSPLSVSSYGSAPTPEAQSPTPLPESYSNAMNIDTVSSHRMPWTISDARRVKATDLGSRTRKRVRDNRPDESVIHENTLQKLFSAQRNHPHASPIPSTSPPPAQTPLPSRPQKSTLHAFWKLPAPPVQPPSVQIPQERVAPDAPRCEDCDAALLSEHESMDIDMDVDGGGCGSQFACNDCGKLICGTCAVVSSTRHCLQCATTGRNSRRWW